MANYKTTIGCLSLWAAVAGCEVQNSDKHVTRRQMSNMGTRMANQEKAQAEKQAAFYEARLELIAERHRKMQAESCDLLRQGIHALASSHKGKNRASRLVDEACEVWEVKDGE